jgi:dipeptidyl aminopeptidase/acylaminoacyl peptidase
MRTSTSYHMMRCGLTRMMLLGSLFLSSVTAGLKADGSDLCSSSAILSEMRSYYPVPISASPDGKLIVARAKPEGQTDSGLVVIDSQSHKVIRSLKWSDPMIHVLWRADGQSVSFFSQEKGTNLRHLIVWKLEDGTTREIPTPATFNQPHVLWSPDGSKLAFSQETRATVIVSASGSAQPIVYPGKFAIFAWSSDSLNLALIPDNESQQVIVVDASSPRLVQRIATKISGKVVDVAWQPRKNMLLLVEHKDGSRYVVEYDPAKETERILFSWNLDLRSPAWLPPGQGYIFQRLQNGTGDLFIGSEKDGVEPRRLPLDGISDFREVLPDGKTIAATHRSVGPVEVLRVPLDEAKPEVLATANLSALGTVSPEPVLVPSFDGVKIPLLVWHSPNANEKSRTVVVRVHGNLHGAETPVWQEDIQMYLKHGVDFIGVNYRGSSGYGSQFEKAGNDEQRARDVIAACDYAHSALGAPYDRIVVLGHSNGATIALAAGLLQPNHMGVLVIASLPGPPYGWQGFGFSKRWGLQVIGLHGEKDRIVPPTVAQRFIERAFGSDVLAPLDKHWYVLRDEDHVLHLDSSWAIVHSVILRQLGLITCDKIDKTIRAPD